MVADASHFQVFKGLSLFNLNCSVCVWMVKALAM